MSQKLNLPATLTGLTDAEVQESRKKHGPNLQQQKVKSTWWKMILEILREPMLVLLIIISVIYFVLEQYGEAWFMMAAIIIVSGISFYQDNRSRKALEALEALNTPLSKVIRNGIPVSILTPEIVPGDLVIAEEGSTINADGKIVHSNDFSVNESTLTGEAQAIYKSSTSEDPNVFSGTLASSGLAVYKVEKTGTSTRVGQIGKSIAEIKEEPTPLQKQIEAFVKGMALIGIVVFLGVWAFQYIESKNLLASLLKGLTLAMSILPEEIPVAFTTFMALGSRRLMKEGIIVKKTRTVETLGSATVICADKTGTITENKMTLQSVYAFSNNRLYTGEKEYDKEALTVIETAMWASEPVPFDPMEKTLHQIYEKHTSGDQRESFSMVHEYPLEGVPPMMTHIFENKSGVRIIAAKGAPEAILKLCHLTDVQLQEVQAIIDQLALQGYRILGVATASHTGNDFPAAQQSFPFALTGLVVFYDPPKPGIENVFRKFYEAGIEVKIITGDNPLTTKAIAGNAGIKNADDPIDGEALMKLNEKGFNEALRKYSLFTRMFPEAKLAAINGFKKDNQVVAMVGDGVNDGPALKAAHIGIAMGQRGTEMAKSAAALILMNDDLSKMVDAIATGRRIYSNLKKAIQYIISIHIPIILTVSLPLFLGWIYPDIFTPVHVIFLELVMGPTCSIVFENEPMEKNTMLQKPRPMTETFLNWHELGMSILQGLMITAGVLFMYQLTLKQGGNEAQVRTMVFSTLIFANIFLTLVNRSFYFSFVTTLRYKNDLLLGIITITLAILATMLFVDPVAMFFQLVHPALNDIGLCAGIAFISVFWFEAVKVWRRARNAPILERNQ
ncbi:MAG: cation-translocating P-type ATPase [Saprospiraceae bacterium]|nr:cation-translocating P-type ATPase [Candidatus Opimibacter skivensis]